MNTSLITHRRAAYAAAATAAIASLMAITLNSASAMPVRDDPSTVPGATIHAVGHYVGHTCFITPESWSEALAGPMPRCYTYVR